MNFQLFTPVGRPRGSVITAASLAEARAVARSLYPYVTEAWPLHVVGGHAGDLVLDTEVASREAGRTAVALREDAGGADAQLEDSFKRIGLGESSAKVAAAGRAGLRRGAPRLAESQPPAETLEGAFTRMGSANAAVAARGRG